MKAATKASDFDINTVIEVVNKAKAVEEGTSSIEDLLGTSEKNEIQKALNKVTKQIISALEQAQDSDDERLTVLLEDVKQAKKLSLPIDRQVHPYTSTLLLFTCQQTTLAADQEKSPYADTFPGKIGENAERVSNEEVRINFDFADLSYLRMLVAPENWQSTGLYAPAGSTITINVPEGIDHLDVQIGAHTDKLGHLETWDRAPIVAFSTTLEEGRNEISSPFGGLIYFIPTKSEQNKVARITVDGAVRAPHYLHGKTDLTTWNETIKKYEAPWLELESEHIVLTVPSDVIEGMDSPDGLMDKWDDMIEQYNDLVGLKRDGEVPHRIPDRPHRITSDIQISAGYMHAGYPIMIPNHPAAPHTVNFDHVKDLDDGWGFWHEMGHEYQQVAWFWNDIVEVSVNIYSLYIQDYYNNPSRLLTRDQDGNTYYDIAAEFINKEDPDKNFNQIGLFERLVMIRQLQMGYKWDFFTNLHIAYRDLPENKLPEDDNEQEKIDTFVVMCSKVSGDNLLEFFRLWGMPYTDRARKEVEALGLPDPSLPLTTLVEEGDSPA